MSQVHQDVHHPHRMKCVAVFVFLLPLLASAQAYPVKPIRLIAPSSPGSGIDIVSRIVAQKVSEQMRQQVVVDNRAGAAGNLGAELAAKSPADGYTLFMSSPAHAINTGLYHKLNYDLVRDFIPVSLLTIGHYCVVVHPSLPVQSVKDLIALARARRGQLNYASAGAGNSNHLAGALFLKMAHIEMVHVPYKGSGPALTDLVGGQVQVMFSNLTPALLYIKAKRLRALAVSGEKRSAIVPELPTVSEAGVPGYRVVTWFGLMTPTGVSPEIVARLQRELISAMQAPDVRDKLAGEGAEPVGSTSEQFAAFIRSEITQWVKVVHDVGVSVE
jgi:tripartite-type tricarboxylate transporter receptor subunit TctC